MANQEKAGDKGGVLLTGELAAIPDPRGKNGRRYSIGGVLTLVTAATAGGARSLRAIADWGAARSVPELLQLGILRGGAPSEKAIRTLLHRLDGSVVDGVIYAFLRRSIGELSGRAVALDGKTVRGAREGEGTAPHLMSAVTHEVGHPCPGPG
jgi:DDE family transposase